MAEEKKRGFFQRLFGGGEAQPASPPEPEHLPLPGEDVIEAVDAALSPVLPPDLEIALEEAMHEAGELVTPEADTSGSLPPAGPPETRPDYIEALKDEIVEETPPVVNIPPVVTAPPHHRSPHPRRRASRTGSSASPPGSSARRTS